MSDLRPPNRFADVTADLLARGYHVRFRAAGTSMRPSIDDGDHLTIAPIRGDLEPGAVAVYRSGDRLFAHRLIAVGRDADGGRTLSFRGDAAVECDPPVAARQILGIVIDVERGSVLAAFVARARTAALPVLRLRERSRATYLAVSRRLSFS